jgi:hypothetical protein
MLFSIGFLGNIQGKTDLQDESAPDQDGQIRQEGISAKKSGTGKIMQGLQAVDQTGLMPPDDYHDGIKEKLDEIFEKERFSGIRICGYGICAASWEPTGHMYQGLSTRAMAGIFATMLIFTGSGMQKTSSGKTEKLGNEEIAELSGFGSVNSLYRAFQTFENKSIGEFRKTRALIQDFLL